MSFIHVRRRKKDTSKSNNIATRKNTAWTSSIYTTWALAQPSEQNIPCQFDDLDPNLYNDVLSRFVSETKRSDGYEYKSNTLYQLANGLNRRVKDIHAGRDLDLFNSSQFAPFRDVLDELLHRKDAGTIPTSPKDVMTYEKEEDLWKKSLGHSSPVQSLTTCIYVALRTFILKGNDTMRQLTFKDFQFEYLTEDKEKVVIVYKKDGIPVGSHFESTKNVRGFYQNVNKYLEKCPQDVRTENIPLFQHPVRNWEGVGDWFHKDKPLGCNFFAKLMKDAFVRAGVDGGYTMSAIRTFSERFIEGARPARSCTKFWKMRGVEITRRVRTEEDTSHKTGLLLQTVLGTPLIDVVLSNPLVDVDGITPNNITPFPTLLDNQASYPDSKDFSPIIVPSMFNSTTEASWDSTRDVTTMTNNLITRTLGTEAVQGSGYTNAEKLHSNTNNEAIHCNCTTAEKVHSNINTEKPECSHFNSMIVEALLGIKRELSEIKEMEAKRLKIEERKLVLMEMTRIDS